MTAIRPARRVQRVTHLPEAHPSKAPAGAGSPADPCTLCGLKRRHGVHLVRPLPTACTRAHRRSVYRVSGTPYLARQASVVRCCCA